MSDQIRIETSPNRLIINGADVSASVIGLTFRMNGGNLPTLDVEYLCIDSLTVDGEATVIHYCPIRGIVGKGAE